MNLIAASMMFTVQLISDFFITLYSLLFNIVHLGTNTVLRRTARRPGNAC